MTSPVLAAYKIEKSGKSEPTTIYKHQKKDDSFTWVHLDASNKDVRKFIETEITGIDTFTLDALLADETRPRMEQLGDDALMILRGINLNDENSPEDMVAIRLLISKNQVISLRRRKVKAIAEIEELLAQGNGPKNSGDFLYMLSSLLFKRMEPAFAELDDKTDDIEEQILDFAGSELREAITKIRKQAIMFKRYIVPQRDAIYQLRMANFSWINNDHKRHIQEACNHLNRYIENLDAIRERAQIIKDEIANILADKLNKNMYILSVIAAVFLPISFLTGMLGVNIGGIPGVDNAYAFWIFTGLLTTIVTIQVWLFKKLDWF